MQYKTVRSFNNSDDKIRLKNQFRLNLKLILKTHKFKFNFKNERFDIKVHAYA